MVFCMNRRVVYVDDEPHNLTVFEAALTESWQIFTFDKPEEALARVKEIDPAIIVSDQRMPSTKGAVFLEKCKKLCPLSVRIIVTGYSDEDLVIESVRRAQVFDYIRKPWDMEDLDNSLKRAFDQFDFDEMSLLAQKNVMQLNDENTLLKDKIFQLEDLIKKYNEHNKHNKNSLSCNNSDNNDNNANDINRNINNDDVLELNVIRINHISRKKVS